MSTQSIIDPGWHHRRAADQAGQTPRKRTPKTPAEQEAYQQYRRNYRREWNYNKNHGLGTPAGVTPREKRERTMSSSKKTLTDRKPGRPLGSGMKSAGVAGYTTISSRVPTPLYDVTRLAAQDGDVQITQIIIGAFVERINGLPAEKREAFIGRLRPDDQQAVRELLARKSA